MATQEEIQSLRQRLDELEKILAKEEELKIFPQKGDEYWILDRYHPFGLNKGVASDSNGRLLAYETKEEAERARDIEVAKMKLKHIIATYNGNWIPDWDDKEEIKLNFVLEGTYIGIQVRTQRKEHPNWMYMKSKEVAKEIRAKHKDLIELIGSE